MSTVQEAVELGANIFAMAEDRAADIKTGMRDLRAVLQTVCAAGHIGGLEYEMLACRADELATGFEAQLFELHSHITERARELGIDLPVSPRSGGGGR